MMLLSFQILFFETLLSPVTLALNYRIVINKKSVTLICILTFFTIGANRVNAQNAYQDFGLWGNISLFGGFGKKGSESYKIKYYVSDRQSNTFDPSGYVQNLFLTGFGYSIEPEWTILTGWGHQYTSENGPHISSQENRIFEQAEWHKVFNYFSMVSRTRLEQRFIQDVSNVAWRLRERLKVSIPLGLISDLSFVTSDEVLWNLNSIENSNEYGVNGLAQNRFFIGLGYKFNSHIKTAIGYLNQWVRRTNGTPDYMGNMINADLNFVI